MSRPPRRAKQDWSHKLARPLAVDNGMKLTTLADARTAVLYEKPRSTVKCEYVWRRTDRWINFPWSTAPPLVPDHRGRRTAEA